MTSGRSARSRRLGAYIVLGVLFLCATAAALSTLWTRHLGERAMDEVALVVDGLELAQWSASTGERTEGLLRRLKALGVTGVGVHEWTLYDAAQRGQVFIVTKATLRAMESPLLDGLPPEIPDDAVLIGWREGIAPWLDRALAGALPHVAVPVGSGVMGGGAAGDSGGGSLWRLVRSSPSFIALGLDPEEIEAVRAAGLWVVPRLQGEAPESPDELLRRLEAVDGERFGPVVFKGTSVSGFPSFLDTVSASLKATNAAIGLIEFAPQHGFAALAKGIGYRVVRVHSITDREMAVGIAAERAVDRWLRAVRERQIRLLYVRLLPQPEGQDPTEWAEANLAYLEQLTTALRRAGFRLAGDGDPEGSSGQAAAASLLPHGSAPPVSIISLILIALATGACAGWVAWALLARVLDGLGVRRTASSAGWVLSWAVVGAASLLALAAGGVLWLKGYTVLARQGMALAAAVAFPVAAVWAALQVVEGRERGEVRDSLGRWSRALLGFAVALAITLVGASFVAALLSDVRFLLRIEEFRGVKLAHAAPLAILAVMLAAPALLRGPGVLAGAGSHAVKAPGGPERKGRRVSPGALIGAWLNHPVRVWELLVLVGAALVLWVYLVRTGNQGLPVPALEEALRRLLEENLYARPRTKEILIGHPALVTALACWTPWARSDTRWRRLAAHAMLLAGAVGQISIINTFAHAHSALAISVARTAYGVWIGLVLGAVAVALAAWVDRRSQTKRPVQVQSRVSRSG